MAEYGKTVKPVNHNGENKFKNGLLKITNLKGFSLYEASDTNKRIIRNMKEM
jgi:hypothetical protein